MKVLLTMGWVAAAVLAVPQLLPGAPEYQFPAARMSLPPADTQVLSFQVNEAAAEDQSPEWSVVPPGVAEVILPPRLLAGEKTGYFRIRTLQSGRCTLFLGQARMELQVESQDGTRAGPMPPVVVSPSQGSVVWGKILVAVEAFARGAVSEGGRMELRSADGRRFTPDPELSERSGPWSREVFALDTEDWPAGPHVLSPCWVPERGPVLTGRPLVLSRGRPDPEHQIAGECEEHLGASGQERFGEKTPQAVPDETASGGSGVGAFSGNPVWTLPHEVRAAGLYQLFLTVRGEMAGGALPSLGIYLNDSDRTVANVRLASRGWHRLPVGPPVRLEPGAHHLVVQFRNDFHVSKNADRNLWLDRYELARIDAAPASSASTGEGTAMMMMAMESSESPPPDGVKAESVRLAFRDPVEGAHVNGPVTLEALCRWSGYDPLEAPAVALLLNGKPISHQYGPELRFEVPMACFVAGANEIQLVAESGRLRFQSTVQRIHYAPPPGWKPARTGVERVYGVLDPAWDPGMRQRWEGKNQEPRRDAAFFANGESYLNLPEGLSGRYRVELEARGQVHEGAPELEVVLRAGGVETPVDKAAFYGGRSTKAAGSVDLPDGAKQLVVRFTNDRADAGGDRNVWLRRVRLVEETAADRPADPPVLRVSYPTDRASIGRCGLVVLDGVGWRDGDRAEVLLEDRVIGHAEAPRGGLGSWVVPWTVRDPAPGGRVLQIRVLRGREGTGVFQAGVPVEVTTTDDTDYDRAVHVLNRFAYGPEPGLVAEMLVEGIDPWLERRLREDMQNPVQAAFEEMLVQRFPGEGKPNDLTGRVLAELVQSPNPVRARFVMWVENHFSTWQQKAGALNKWREHEAFNHRGPGRFKDLLFTSATSPAMLVYLDQNRSFARKLNENYAREILELHTVGVKGGYDQEDVTALARLLTGWTLSEEVSTTGRIHDLEATFRFEPGLNVPGAQRIMGLEFAAAEPGARYERACTLLEMLAMHPSTARFISRKLAEHYVAVPAPEELVAAMSGTFLESGGDLGQVMLAMSRHPAFWEGMKRPRVITPLDYAVRTARMIDQESIRDMGTFLKLSGMGLFDRATPDGYPQADASYADSNALMQRWRWSAQFRFPSLDFPWTKSAPSAWDEGQRQAAIDRTAMRFNGRLLGERSNRAIHDWLRTRAEPLPDIHVQLGMMVARLPESHVR